MLGVHRSEGDSYKQIETLKLKPMTKSPTPEQKQKKKDPTENWEIRKRRKYLKN